MERYFGLKIGFIVMLSLIEEIQGDAEYRLISDLMKGYDLRVRPSTNYSQPLNVTFGLALSQIIDVDEKNQIITTNCWLNQAWIDSKLRWTPEEYEGMKVIRLPYDIIWKPDILLYNNADVSSYRSSISTNVIVTSDGNVTWLSMVIFRSSCAVDVKYFPFDEQNCTMLFASWTYDGFQLNLDKVGENGDMSNYIRNSEWTLVKLHAVKNIAYYSCCEEPYPDVTYTIQIRRKPLFYVFNMILPCLLITLVALLGFYIPSDSGEKVTMGITTLLSMTVFLMLVAENMPPTSDVLPLVGLYYGITIVIVSLATAMTAFTLNIHHMGNEGKPVSPLVRLICLRVLARVLFMDARWNEQTSKCSTFKQCCPRRGQNNKNNSASKKFDFKDMRRQEHDYKQMKASSASQTAEATKKDRSMQIPLSENVNSSNNINPAELNLKSPNFVFPTSKFDYSFNSFSRTNNRERPLSFRSTRNFHAEDSNKPIELLIRQEWGRIMDALSRIHHFIDLTETRASEKERRDACKKEWQRVALVVDRVLLLSFTFATLAITAAMLLHAPLAYDFIFGSAIDDANFLYSRKPINLDSENKTLGSNSSFSGSDLRTFNGSVNSTHGG